MEITPFSQRSLDGEGSEMLLDFKKAHQQDLKAIAEILARISHQSPEKVEILLETMLKQLIQPKTPFYETATPTERAQAFRDWASSHDRGSALLSDYAVSRDSIYDDECLWLCAEPDHTMYGDAVGATSLLLGQGEKLYIAPQNLIEFWNVYF